MITSKLNRGSRIDTFLAYTLAAVAEIWLFANRGELSG